MTKQLRVENAVNTYTESVRFDKWRTNPEQLKELKRECFAFAENLDKWFGAGISGDPSLMAIVCSMLRTEEQLMQDIEDSRETPDWDEPGGDRLSREADTTEWHRTYAYTMLICGVMSKLGFEDKGVQEGVFSYMDMYWCRGTIRKEILKRLRITPGELAQMVAERLPKQKVEELEVFATTLQVAKTLGVDYE